MVTPARRFLMENCPYYYPFGNTRVQNVLTNANSWDGGSDKGSIVKVMFNFLNFFLTLFSHNNVLVN